MLDSALPIRPGMDVYGTYQHQYIGSVVQVFCATQGEQGMQNASASHQAQLNPVPLQVEQGEPVQAVKGTAQRELGEEMGPFPTIALGNRGPINQSAAHEYATEGPDHPFVTHFAVRPGRINLGPFTHPLYIPTSAIRSISLERIILDVERGEIPERWRFPPD